MHSPRDVLSLQRSIGNGALRGMMNTPASSSGARARVQARRLTVSPVHDPLEAEADRMAARVLEGAPSGVMEVPQEPATRSSMPAGSGFGAAPSIGTDSLSLRGDSGLYVEPAMEQRLEQSEGGQPLDGRTRARMESGFGADFSGVRIHTGEGAASMNRDLGARAFTYGSDIYFGEGQFSPDTQSGQYLIAHELTHTLQQGASSIQRKADPARTVSFTVHQAPENLIQCDRRRAPAIDNRKDKARTDLPSVPSIAASYSLGDGQVFGSHARVFLAMSQTGAMNHYMIDLSNVGNLAVNIEPVNEKGWPDPQKSTTWRINDAQAESAMRAAEYYRDTWAASANAMAQPLPTGFFSGPLAKARKKLTREYKYSGWGVGYRRYNCAGLAERILRAAGIKRGAGKIISTPSQLATGETHRMEMLRIGWRGFTGLFSRGGARRAQPGGVAPLMEDPLAVQQGGNVQAPLENGPGLEPNVNVGGEPDLDLDEPGVGLDQPGVGLEPGMDDEQPGMNLEEPGMDFQEPGGGGQPGEIVEGEEDQEEGR